MTALVIFLILALIFGVGSVLKGMLWLGLIALAFLIAAGVAARAAFRST